MVGCQVVNKLAAMPVIAVIDQHGYEVGESYLACEVQFFCIQSQIWVVLRSDHISCRQSLSTSRSDLVGEDTKALLMLMLHPGPCSLGPGLSPSLHNIIIIIVLLLAPFALAACGPGAYIYIWGEAL